MLETFTKAHNDMRDSSIIFILMGDVKYKLCLDLYTFNNN